MGAVFKGRTEGGTCVAVKKSLYPTLRGGAVWSEAYLLSTLSHPNVLSLLMHAQSDDGSLLIVTPCFDTPLKAYVPNVPFLCAEARPLARLLIDVQRALSYLHGERVAHRDVKMDNVMVDPHPLRAVLIDFGLACRFDDSGDDGVEARCLVGDAAGTLTHAAPEVIDCLRRKGEPVYDAFRADVWSLAVLMLEAWTGRLPFSEADAEEDALFASFSSACGMGHSPLVAYELLSKTAVDLPLAAHRVVQGCLHPRAERRWKHAVSFA